MLFGHVLVITPLVSSFYTPALAAQSVAPFWDPITISMIAPPRNGEQPPTAASISVLIPTVALTFAPTTFTESPYATLTAVGLPPFACDSISECSEPATAMPSASGAITTVNSLNPIVPPSPCTVATEVITPILPSDFPPPSLGASAPSASASEDSPYFPLGTTSRSASVPPATMISAECRTMYVVSEGDLFQLITDEYSVSLTQLLAANPGFDSDCGNLKAGERLCIP
ncbi:hypothetical protein EV121DRAFT_293784 [Schizophyllum commune]